MGEKLAGRFVLVRRGREGEKDQWLLFHKRDDHAVDGWDPEDHPRSVKSGRTNDEVQAAPAATWSSQSLWTGPTEDELAALDALGKAGEWTFGEHTLRLTNLDKVLFPAKPGRGGAKALTKRDLIRHHAVTAPAMLPYLADRPVNLHRYPRRHRQARLLAQGGAVARAGLDHSLALRGPRPRRDRVVLRRGLARRARLDGELWRHRAAPVDVHGGRAPSADLGDDRHRPGGQGHLRRRARAGAPVPHRARSPRRGCVPEGHRQARRPDLGARRRGLRVQGHQRVGGAPVACHRRHRPGPRELGVGEGQARRSHPARLHPERREQDPRRTVQRPSGARAHPCRCRSAGTSSTTPSWRPIDGPSEMSATDSPEPATRSRR